MYSTTVKSHIVGGPAKKRELSIISKILIGSRRRWPCSDNFFFIYFLSLLLCVSHRNVLFGNRTGIYLKSSDFQYNLKKCFLTTHSVNFSLIASTFMGRKLQALRVFLIFGIGITVDTFQ